MRDGLDADLQYARDAGAGNGVIETLLRKHDAWIQRVAASRLAAWPRARAVYDVEDVAQVVRRIVFRALREYRYACPAAACAVDTSIRPRRPGRPRNADWTCATLEDWTEHVAAHHEPGHLPRNDVGRYVRFNVRRRTEAELKAFYRKRSIAPGSSSELGMYLRDGMNSPRYEPSISPLAEKVLLLRELETEAFDTLEPMAHRMAERLVQGYSTREAVAIEREGDPGRSLFSCATQSCQHARDFLDLACERLSQ